MRSNHHNIAEELKNVKDENEWIRELYHKLSTSKQAYSVTQNIIQTRLVATKAY